MSHETKVEVLATSNLRTLWSPPSMHQDWGDEYEERASGWWELFVDLLLVGACTNMADGFKDNPTGEGLCYFLLQVFTFQAAWYGYVSYSSRFRDTSLSHSMLLFIFLAGTSGLVIYSSGFGPAELLGYTTGLILQRAALILMFANVAYYVPRARQFAFAAGIQLLVQVVVLAVAASLSQQTAVLWLWALTIVIDRISLPISSVCLGDALVPINIDHFGDREGAFVMVVLGESVLSEAISYRSLASDSRDGYEYVVGALLCFLMTFSLALMYFHVQPERKEHAYRQSRARGLCLIQTNTLLTTALLAVGTGTKLAMATVSGGGDDTADKARAAGVEQAPYEAEGDRGMSDGAVWILHGSLSAVLLLLLIVRLLHYGGKEPKATDCMAVWRVKIAWWVLLGVWWVLPIATGVGLCTTSGAGGVRPLVSIGACSGLSVGLMLGESSLTHVLHGLVADQAARRGQLFGKKVARAEWVVEGRQRLLDSVDVHVHATEVGSESDATTPQLSYGSLQSPGSGRQPASSGLPAANPEGVAPLRRPQSAQPKNVK